jgi:hypothetical protein
MNRQTRGLAKLRPLEKSVCPHLKPLPPEKLKNNLFLLSAALFTAQEQEESTNQSQHKTIASQI